jgi:hypothetical protein
LNVRRASAPVALQLASLAFAGRIESCALHFAML